MLYVPFDDGDFKTSMLTGIWLQGYDYRDTMIVHLSQTLEKRDRSMNCYKGKNGEYLPHDFSCSFSYLIM